MEKEAGSISYVITQDYFLAFSRRDFRILKTEKSINYSEPTENAFSMIYKKATAAEQKLLLPAILPQFRKS